MDNHTTDTGDLDTGFDLTELRKILLPEDNNKMLDITITLSEKTLIDLRLLASDILKDVISCNRRK